MIAEEKEGCYNFRFAVPNETSADDRRAIKEWLGERFSGRIHDTPEEATEESERISREFYEEFVAQEEARRKAIREAQASDPTPYASQPDEVTPENCELFREVEGERRSLLRMNSAGFNALDEGDLIGLFRKQGCEIRWQAPAFNPEGGYVGTWTGELQEVGYDLPSGERRYCYVICSRGDIDSYCEEAWVTTHRMTARAAADTIEQARAMAYGRNGAQ